PKEDLFRRTRAMEGGAGAANGTINLDMIVIGENIKRVKYHILRDMTTGMIELSLLDQEILA
ncbi:hypothetical protein ACJX0J_013988, partial [Zea mays]